MRRATGEGRFNGTPGATMLDSISGAQVGERKPIFLRHFGYQRIVILTADCEVDILVSDIAVDITITLHRELEFLRLVEQAPVEHDFAVGDLRAVFEFQSVFLCDDLSRSCTSRCKWYERECNKGSVSKHKCLLWLAIHVPSPPPLIPAWMARLKCKGQRRLLQILHCNMAPRAPQRRLMLCAAAANRRSR